ncbi:MAG: L,D-transpeptidase family protein [Patulibacter minatonensis]
MTAEAQYFALQGVEQAVALIELAKDGLNPELAWLGVVLTIADLRTTHSREARDNLKEHIGDKLLDTHIRQSIAYAESAERGVSILEHRPARGNDYVALADEVLARLGLKAAAKKARALLPQGRVSSGGAPTPPTEPEQRHDYRAVSPRARRSAFLGAGALVAMLAAVAVLRLTGGEDGEPVGSTTVVPTAAAVDGAQTGAQPRELDPKTAEDQLGTGHVALKVTRRQLLRTRPDPTGRLVARVGRKTSYGGPNILPIIKARGDWVAVVSPYRKNNKVAWTKVDADAKFVAVEYSIAIRLQTRDIVVRKNGKVIRRFRAAIGQVTHPTPPGRYAITDGLIFNAKTRGPYGCCALVLSARQTKLPAHWTGGDRIAIHGTPNTQSIGLAASLGCLRVGDEASRWLVRKVPPGTTVLVRP